MTTWPATRSSPMQDPSLAVKPRNILEITIGNIHLSSLILSLRCALCQGAFRAGRCLKFRYHLCCGNLPLAQREGSPRDQLGHRGVAGIADRAEVLGRPRCG